MRSPRQISRKYDVRPRKRLGQSFLQDLNIVRKIVAVAAIGPDDAVVEIGAGLGVMTALIAAEAKQVLALEIDPQLVGVLRSELSQSGKVDIRHQDVLKFDLAQAARDLSAEKLKIIGNIPYNISTPILFHLLAYRRVISSAVLMVQKEVAERIAAGTGTKSYGIPSVFTGIYTKTVSAFDVPASCFYPVPKVTSAVIRMDFRTEPLAPIEDEVLFKDIVRLAFSNRRKTLLNNLRRNPGLACMEDVLLCWLKEKQLDVRIRGEALTPDQFIALSNVFSREIALSGAI
jgi:16S rRNA (adenine1518-N6/adenine1519-N6)-dimethyltransferase